MITIAALTALGYPQAELKERIRGAMNVGCSRNGILDIILQMAVYAGFPAALEAVECPFFRQGVHAPRGWPVAELL